MPATATALRPTCPSCGIAVMPGYPRCPKCHAVLPSSGRMNRITEGGGGATTAVAAEDGVRRWPWYLAGIVVLAGAVAVIVIGSSDRKPPPELPDDPVTEEAVVEPEGSAAEEETAAPETPPRRPDPAPAADRLARSMAGVRLFATVEPIGDAIEIRSASCDDARIPGLIADVAPDLRAAGVTTAVCRAVHGALAWTRALP